MGRGDRLSRDHGDGVNPTRPCLRCGIPAELGVLSAGCSNGSDFDGVLCDDCLKLSQTDLAAFFLGLPQGSEDAPGAL